MKLYTMFLLVAAIAGSTFAQYSTASPGEVTTESATASPGEVTTESDTASPSEVTTESAAASPSDVTSESDTASPSEVTTESATASPSDVTTESAAASPGDVTTESAAASSSAVTTVSAAASPGAITTVSPNDRSTDSTSISTAAPSTATPPANRLQCYACEDDNCEEKNIINCPDDARSYDVEEIKRIVPESASDILLRNYRSISRLDGADLNHACYRIQILDNGARKLKLGCIGIPDNLSACQAVRQELQISADDTSDECTACQTNLCNSGGMAQLSLLALLGIFLAKYFI